MISRAFAAAALLAALATAAPARAGDTPLEVAIRSAEAGLAARVGVAVLDTGSGKSWFHKADQRFAMASTSKAIACAALLNGGPRLTQAQAVIRASDIQSYAPVTKTMVDKKATGAEFCAITLRTSDNTAFKKVLDILGGPQAVTAFVRDLGDRETRLDRTEPDLNEAKPGDPRDTTTPRAMAETLRKLILGPALQARARDELTNWLVNNEVGGPLLRAGLPRDWRVADRTGAGGFGTRGIIAVLWPPQRAPIVAVVYLTETKASMDARNAAIAGIGKAIAETVAN